MKKQKIKRKAVKISIKNHKALKLTANIKGLTMTKLLNQILDEQKWPKEVKTMINKAESKNNNHLKQLEKKLKNS